MPPVDPLTALREAIHAAASARVWGQGVTLAREQRVVGKAAKTDEIEVDVRVPARPTPLSVVLYPAAGEWECNCPSREKACAHVVAAVLAVIQARDSAGAPTTEVVLPVSKTVGGTISYRLEPAPGGLTLERRVIHPDGREEVLPGSLHAIIAKRIPGPVVAAHDVDLVVDQMLQYRGGAVLAGDRLARLCATLADAKDVRLGGKPITTSGEFIRPRATIDDLPDGGVRLRLTTDPTVNSVVSFGVVRIGDVIYPIGEQELQGGRLEKLPASRDFSAAEIPELVGKVLPGLAGRIPVEIRTTRLPQMGASERPRVVFEVKQAGEVLSAMATLVYGDPPRARVDAGRLVHLNGALPLRDEALERQLLYRLRDELHLAPGRRVELTGKDAAVLSNGLAAWLRADARAAGGQPAAVLFPDVDTRNGRFAVTFAAGERRATTEAVLRAWQAGAELVALEGGGWGQVPQAWLDKHGGKVADLLAASGGSDRVPMHALPDLGRLCEDLDLPPPADLQRLRPLVEDFVTLPKAPLPAGLDEILRPYQRSGVDWLSFCRDAGLGCVLADDMGLGKTIQALAAVRGRTLVVSPTSVVWNWADEVRRFRPDLRASVYHGAKRALDEKADIVLTSYPLLRNDIDVLSAVEWDAVYLDESQMIKNPDSQVARAAYKLRADWRVTLSGTPVENRLDELWSQFHFTNPGLLGGRADFAERWGTPIANGDPGAAARLRERIKPFVLRRKKREVAPELPPRTEAVMHVELDEAEREVYDTIRAATQRDVVAMLSQGGGVMAALEALLRLRQASCHRGLIPGQSAESSSKVERLVEALEDAAADGHKALVFSQWTSLLDRIEPALEAAGIAFTRLDGSTVDRQAVVTEFQSEGGPPVMLISLKAGGTGLNLTAADHVFLVDPWWNPAVEDQAADRAHRIGQDKPVMVYRLVARDTVEERILALQASKRALAEAALGGADRAVSLTRDDLLALLA